MSSDNNISPDRGSCPDGPPAAMAAEGPSGVATLAQITLSGNSYERGVQYGKAFRKYLRSFYDWFVGKEPGEVLTAEYRRVIERFEETTARHFPQLLDEIKGWSDGAGLPYAMCRIMAFHNEMRDVLPLACANLIVTDGPQGP